MREENYSQPPMVRPKRKKNVKHGELNTVEKLNKDHSKSVSSDKLKVSSPPS